MASTDLWLPKDYVRFAVSTLPTIVMDDAHEKKALLGYNPMWKEFDPIGGGYMLEKRDLEAIALVAPSAALEIRTRRAEQFFPQGLNVIAQKGRACWVDMKNTIKLFDFMYSPVDICGVQRRVVDAKFLIYIDEKDRC